VTATAGLDLLQITASPIKNIHPKFHSVFRIRDKNVVWVSAGFKDSTTGESVLGVITVDVHDGFNRAWVGPSLAQPLSYSRWPAVQRTAIGFNHFCLVDVGDSRSVSVSYIGAVNTPIKRTVQIARANQGLF
jgi:hypothetical protein